MSSSSSQLSEKQFYLLTHNVSEFISIKLTEDNYHLWKEQMLSLFESQDLLSFIDERSNKGVGELSNKEYSLWKSSNRLVKRWILNSLGEELFDAVLFSGTASDVWANLEDTFGSTASMRSSSSQPSAKYPYPPTINVSNFVSVKLSRGNYHLWSAPMLCLIKSQHLLGFIRKLARRATRGLSEEELLRWKMSDGLVKGWILGSLSEEAFSNLVDPAAATASDVWAQLEDTHDSVQAYAYPSTLDVSNFVSIKLDESNYVPWRKQMLHLIQSQNLHSFIDERSRSRESELSDKEYFGWKRSDQLVKGWILGSLNKELFQTVFGLSTAGDIWAKLEITFASIHGTAEFYSTESEEAAAMKNPNKYLPLYKAAIRGNWEIAKEIFISDRDAITAKITCDSQTALHLAAGTGKAVQFVRNLVDLMPSEALAATDRIGDTALNMAAMAGKIEVAKILLNKNEDLLYILNNDGQSPLNVAALYAHKDMLLYLLTKAKNDVSANPFRGHSGFQLMGDVIVARFFDVALLLIERFPDLATRVCADGFTHLQVLAGMASAFCSGSHLKFWQRIIYSCVPVELQNDTKDSNGGDVENPVGCKVPFNTIKKYSFSVCQKLHVVFWEVISFIVPQIKHVRDQKLMHRQALQLLKCLCRKFKSENKLESFPTFCVEPIGLAARNGTHEVVEEIVETFPDAITSHDMYGHYLFQLAVIHRCENIFNLIYQMSEHRSRLVEYVDTSKNNILHLAGKLAPPHKLNRVPGAALQMQREIQWYKEVKKFVTPSDKEKRNNANQTPAMVFTEEHKGLMMAGEKWMKDTATSCTIAAALIATVAFAAAFTVPGGNNDENGLPILFNERAFIIFMICDAISLFTSATSLLMFLSILTSRYAESDFLYVLPKRLIIGLLTLFLSITTMIIAFSATLTLVFENEKVWILILMVAFASLPVTSFVSLQFPLLVDLISSTYGRGIFGKQSDRPFY